ncbi:HAMP domain-containing histidine kinase [Agrobacterium tumefaciens]|nr:HAMP domain-containing histidine kinase [Agrobacterium tumefaciens]
MEDQRYKNCTNGEDMLTLCHTPDHGILSVNRPRQQGTGLGLYVASQILKAHEGTLNVSSTVQERVVYYFQFSSFKINQAITRVVLCDPK